MNQAAILLAAGRSVRMGRDKTVLELNGEWLVERHLRQLQQSGVTNSIVVCNADNEVRIQERTQSRTVQQCGDSMTAGVRSGIEAIGVTDSIWIVCVNDTVEDSDYERIARAAAGDMMAIPTTELDRVFYGGHLRLTTHGMRILEIVERPLGGCPPGAWANIMIHRIHGRLVIDRLTKILAAGSLYESAINELIGAGIPALAVPVQHWVGIKTPEDWERARGLSKSFGGAL